ncbi:hypothetical protein IH981_03045 [Patescibacteria group bacterium]|nr:hypothetical protein [Patescibacteria group bacterium]
MFKLSAKLFIITLFLASVVFTRTPEVVAAGSIYLSPGAATIAKDSSFSVSVRINTGGSSVDSVQANLSYPTDKLNFLGVGYGGTSFEIQAESSGGSGSVRMARGTLSAKSGDLLVGTVTFQAKVNSGNAFVSFTSGTEGVKGGTVVVSATGSGTYIFTNPAPAPKKDKTDPKISNIEIKNLSRDSATITWKTNESSNSVVEWGPTDKYGIVSSASKLVKNHSISLDKRLLLAGFGYHFRVKSKDKSGNEATSEDQLFKVPGYIVNIKVINESGQPISEVVVNLVSAGNAKTNSQGIATFRDVSAGDYAVIVQFKGETISPLIKIEEREGIQEFEVKLNTGVITGEFLTEQKNLVVILIVLIAVTTFALYNFRGRIFHKKKSSK